MSVDSEIREQPEVAARLLGEGATQVSAVATRIRRARSRYVVIAARGTSDHAAVFAQYVLGARNRLPVALAVPSLASLYQAPPRFDGAAVIGISQSGASPDVVAVLDAARAQGRPTVAITNTVDSALGRAAELVIDLRAGHELAIAATKTYTAELLAIAMLSVALDGAQPTNDPALRAVPGAILRALDARAQAEEAALALAIAGVDRAFVIGRGFEYATARELALKIKELAGVFAEGYSAADLQHGPLTLVGSGVPVVTIAPSGRPAEGLRTMLRSLGQSDDATTIVLSDRADLRTLGRYSISLPGGVEEWVAPIVNIIPGQLFALALARSTGHDPERPRLLRKVTLTS